MMQREVNKEQRKCSILGLGRNWKRKREQRKHCTEFTPRQRESSRM